MSWFKRIKEGITTSTLEKKETPEGLWYKCPQCKQIVTAEDNVDNLYVCTKCEYHQKINSKEYFEILFDDNKFTELFPNLTSGDTLKFEDTKKYVDRLKDTQKKTGLKDAITSAHGKIDGQDLVICCMEFSFIGGSMGSVVGEKISRSIDYCIEHKVPILKLS